MTITEIITFVQSQYVNQERVNHWILVILHSVTRMKCHDIHEMSGRTPDIHPALVLVGDKRQICEHQTVTYSRRGDCRDHLGRANRWTRAQDNLRRRPVSHSDHVRDSLARVGEFASAHLDPYCRRLHNAILREKHVNTTKRAIMAKKIRDFIVTVAEFLVKHVIPKVFPGPLKVMRH